MYIVILHTQKVLKPTKDFSEQVCIISSKTNNKLSCTVKTIHDNFLSLKCFDENNFFEPVKLSTSLKLRTTNG